MKISGQFVFLLVTLIIAFILRFVHLGQIPEGFTADEASQGYAAYSLLQTGQDEWGSSYPVSSFRAFGDYRAPLQTYLMIPSIAIFGLNEFSVRLPSAIFGLLAILAVFLLANELFPGKRWKVLGLELSVGHLAAIFLTVSPWHIQFSRTALEANLGSLLFPLGLYLLLRGLRDRPRLLLFSALVLGLNLYSYLAAKLFVPLFLAAFILLRRKELLKLFRDDRRNLHRLRLRVAIALLIFLAFAVPIYSDTIWGEGNVRGKDLIITNFNKEDLAKIDHEQYFSPLSIYSPALSRFFANKLTFSLESFSDNFISYLSPTFWFSDGGHETTYSIFPGYGLLPLWFLPFILLSFYFLVSSKNKSLPIIAAWLLLAILPAAITKLGFRPNRVGSLLGFWEIIAALGFIEAYTRYKIRPYISLLLTCFIFISFVFYLNLYFFSSRVLYPSAMSYGFRDLVASINQHKRPGEEVIIQRGDEGHIFIAFYNQLEPKSFQQQSSIWWNDVQQNKLLFVDMLDPYRLDDYVFKTIDTCTDFSMESLVVIKAAKMKDEYKPYVVDIIAHSDQTPAFYLIRATRPKTCKRDQ